MFDELEEQPESVVLPEGVTIEQLEAPPDTLLRGGGVDVIDKNCEACGLHHRVIKDDETARCRSCKGLIWQPS